MLGWFKQKSGIRMFASRDDKRRTAADCRMNCEDFLPGAELLQRYAATLPAAGTEFRRQYVVVQSVPPSEWRS